LRSVSLSFIIGLCVRVLNALDLVHFIMGHHKLVQQKMGGAAGGQGEGTGGQLPPPLAPTWSRPCYRLLVDARVGLNRLSARFNHM